MRKWDASRVQPPGKAFAANFSRSGAYAYTVGGKTGRPLQEST